MPGLLSTVTAALSASFDPTWGGFGAPPKFPRPTLVDLCLRHFVATRASRSLEMATTTLDAMAAGGMHDHLAGGFARYSTDRRWLVPHFEKMLTDQALLARAYLHAWQVTGRRVYADVAASTLDYVLDELSAPTGGLFSSEDADADGHEGGHATFTRTQLEEALAGHGELVELAAEWYGITEEGNWEGTNVLHRPLGGPLERSEQIETCRRLLLAARRRRPQPAIDDKVLTEWNAMAGSALAEAAAVTADPRWHRRAEEIGEYLAEGPRRPDGRWLRVLGGDQPAFASDYAWLVECFLRLAELTGRARWVEHARSAADEMLRLFADDRSGGLFTTGHDAERLVVRAMDIVDGATPSANSVAAHALLRLSGLSGEAKYRLAAERILTLAGRLLAEQPMALADMIGAVGLAEGGSEVVVTGNRPDLLAEVRRRWLPDAVVASGEPLPGSPLWEGREEGWAYVCRHFACNAPVDDPDALAALLDDAQPHWPPVTG